MVFAPACALLLAVVYLSGAGPRDASGCRRDIVEVSLQRQQRLTSAKAISCVYREGRSRANRVLVLYCLWSEGSAQAAFSVSRRMGNAVKRNGIRRRLKEAYRKYADRMKPGAKLLVIARARAATSTYEELEAALVDLLSRSGVLVR